MDMEITTGFNPRDRILIIESPKFEGAIRPVEPEVVVVGSPNAAREQVESTRFSIIMSNLRFPAQDGRYEKDLASLLELAMFRASTLVLMDKEQNGNNFNYRITALRPYEIEKTLGDVERESNGRIARKISEISRMDKLIGNDVNDRMLWCIALKMLSTCNPARDYEKGKNTRFTNAAKRGARITMWDGEVSITQPSRQERREIRLAQRI